MRKANIENENKTNRKQQLEGNRDYTGRRKLKKKKEPKPKPKLSLISSDR